MSDTSIVIDNSYSFESKERRNNSNILQLTAFNVQEVIIEFLSKYMQYNDPADSGFLFTSRYNTEFEKSEILLELVHDYKKATSSKRPAVFVERGDVSLKTPTIGTTIGLNPKESESGRLTLNQMPVQVVVIASPLGVAESIAEWIKQGLISYQIELQQQFGFRKLRVSSLSKPQKYIEGKDYFAIIILIDVVFDEGYVVNREDLKLKTVSRSVFDSVTTKIFNN